jgi:hypothetical protein
MHAYVQHLPMVVLVFIVTVLESYVIAQKCLFIWNLILEDMNMMKKRRMRVEGIIID